MLCPSCGRETPAYHPNLVQGICQRCYDRDRMRQKRKSITDKPTGMTTYQRHGEPEPCPNDTGCGYHHLCRTCPFPLCVREELKPQEAAQIAREYRELGLTASPTEEPEQKPVRSLLWQKPTWWDDKYHIPSTCPRCGRLLLNDGQAPFEIYCITCGTQILAHVPVPAGWRGYSLPSRSIIKTMTAL